jgi:hypothetical protein
MNEDLDYKNKFGISLRNILDVLNSEQMIGKKEIQTALNTDKSIDTLLKKLEDISLIEKKKSGTKILYTVTSKVETTVEPKVTQTKKTKKSNKTKEISDSVSPVLEEPVLEEPVLEEPVLEEPVLEEPVLEIQEELTVHEPVTSIVSPVIEETIQPRKAIKAKPSRTKTPAEINKINQQTEIVSKEHQITSLVEVTEKKQSRGPKTEEVDDSALSTLKKEMESKLGKEVTAVLHKRNDRVVKARKKTASEIYEDQQKISGDVNDLDMDNPYRFVLNFFTTTINGENATPYFRRRDEYVVKSIYNKFKSLCEIADPYVVDQQNLPFYRVLTINMKDRVVKMYHIDMNRVVRGVYTLFKLNSFDDMFITFKN